MTTIRITHTKNWKTSEGLKGAQIDTLLCKVITEDAHMVEFEVLKVEHSENPNPLGVSHMEGGVYMKRTVPNYEGKAGMMHITKA